jgi:hypothetical protein
LERQAAAARPTFGGDPIGLDAVAAFRFARRALLAASFETAGAPMTHITYRIVRHEDGWAYTADGVFSETFPTHNAALVAARTAAAEQRVPGQTEAIEWEDEKGHWHNETSRGSDRPETDVEDTGS